MPSQDTLDAIDSYWAERFGCSREDLLHDGVRAISHATDLREYAGLYAFRRSDTCIVSVPDAYLRDVQSALGGRTVEDVFNPSALSALFGDHAGIVVGPAAIAYTDRSAFKPEDLNHVRLLEADDAALLRVLAAACDEAEWDHSAIEFERAPVFGRFESGAVVAASSYRRLPDGIATVGIITHPAHRGRGFGRAAASAATAHALDAGLLAQWQTPESNIPSIAIACSLGYEPYCRTIAVRLRS